MTLFKIALKNISAKPGRFLLTSLAVLVGVALTAAVFIFTDSLRETFGNLSQDIESGYDIAVRSEVAFGDRLDAAPVGLDIPAQLAEVDGVAAVQPRVIEFNIIPNRADGEAVTSNGPSFGVNWEDQAPDSRVFAADGRPPAASGEFAIDIDGAANNDFVIGDSYDIQTPEGLVTKELVGTFTFADPEENALVGATLVAFDTDTAVQLLNGGLGYDDVTMTLVEGADQAAVTADVEAILPDGLEVLDREVIADEQAEEFNEFIDIFRTILLVFAFIILLVAAFIIYNVFSIIVGQRIQEIGLLRALGATGKQITRSIAAEALMVGVFATIVGVLGGIPIAAGLQALLAAADFGPDESSTPLRPTTIVVCALLGIGLTLMAAVWPALRARQVSPMAALRQDTTLASNAKSQPVLGAILALVGVVLVVWGFVLDEYIFLLIFSVLAGIFLYLGLTRINRVAGRWALIGLSAVLLAVALTADLRASMLLALLGAAALNAFLGMNILSPSFATPVARTLGAPLAKLGGVPSKLARENAGRSPDRTATAASALMIGLALVTAVAVVADSFKATFADVLDNAVSADWIVVGEQGGPDVGFSPAVGAGLADLPELSDVLPVQWIQDAFRTTVDQDVRTAYSTNLADIDTHFDIDVIERDDSLLGTNAVLLHDDQAEDLNLAVGDTIEVEFNDESTADLVVAGIYGSLAIFDSGWVLSTDLWDSLGGLNDPQDIYITAIEAEGVDTEEARAAIATVTEDFSQLEANTKDEFQENQEEQIGQVLVVINVLLLLSVVLALLGVAITLALSVFERTREIGLTRAVGGTRKQIKRMVRVEGVIVALFGGVLGVGLGVVFGVACVQIIPDDFVGKLAIPTGSLITYLVVAAFAGVAAAYFPARRASKLNVLEAIATGE